jgi:spermidine synthase
VIQWTLIVSVMLFSMGLGSRFSKFLENNLLEKFILIEFTLSVLTAFSSLIAYSAAAYTMYTGFIIYSMSIFIGLMIGLEIPLVIRLNDEFETLRVNVSSILEKDYYGSLIGGLFFAFVGLPYLGLTYTPFILGGINFTVALLLFSFLRPQLESKVKRKMTMAAGVVFLLLGSGLIFAEPIILFGEQNRYKDKIVFQEHSRYQKIVITQWKDNYWLFIDGNQQLSTLDEAMYHEPLVHPAMQLARQHQDVLVLGGGDGCAVREILKYPSVKNITVVDLDPVMTELGLNHPVLSSLNQNALHDPRVKIINKDGYHFIEHDRNFYDVIIIDLPDPKTVELGRLYSYEFYSLLARQLRPHGMLVTQAGSPYYASKAYVCIEKTLQEAGYSTLPIHNQVLTLGQWGWILASKDSTRTNLKQELMRINPESVETHWLNQEALQMITSFGKNLYGIEDLDNVKVNRVHDPVLYKYYLNGNWDLY